MVVIFDGIFSLFLALIPLSPCPIVCTIWLVLANTIKLFGSSVNFFSAIWLDEINIEPSLAIKYSQLVKRKCPLFNLVVVFQSKFLNCFFRSELRTNADLLCHLFSSIICSRKSKTSSMVSE